MRSPTETSSRSASTSDMSWLLREGEVLAAIEEPRPGWALSLQGAVVLHGPRLVHTLRQAVALDVAWCSPVSEGDKECLEVRRLATVPPRRVARPRLGPAPLVVATEGAFERWQLKVGDRLEIR